MVVKYWKEMAHGRAVGHGRNTAWNHSVQALFRLCYLVVVRPGATHFPFEPWDSSTVKRAGRQELNRFQNPSKP